MFWIGFDELMNDAEDNDATLQLYVKDGNKYVSAGDDGKATYSGSTKTWTTQVGSTKEVMYHYNPSGSGDRTAKLVLSYTLSDGTSGKVESDEFILHTGKYVVGTEVYSFERGVLTLRIRIDSSKVNTSFISVEDEYFSCGGVGRISLDSRWIEDDAMYLAYNVGEENVGKEFYCFAELVYSSFGDRWPTVATIDGTIGG